MSFFAFLLLFSQSLWAAQFDQFVYDSFGHPSDVSSLLTEVREGDVVIVGEKHGFSPHHEQQLKVIQALQNLGFVVDVGMEHVPYTLQKPLNDFVSGQLSEDNFLSKLGWKKSSYSTCAEYTENEGYMDLLEPTPFDCYIHTMRQATAFGGEARAINLPRSITSKVSRNGLDSLLPQEQKLLPPNFELGSQSYYERFRELMLSFGGHGPVTDEMIDRMFMSQSLWDETMSWQSLLHMGNHPRHVMVIIVGDFHAAYGDGLAARFYARGAQKVHVISQDIVSGASQKELDLLGKPHPTWGPAGDLVILTNIRK